MSVDRSLRPADPSEDWPEVTFGGGHTPYIDRSEYMNSLLLSPQEAVRYGMVAGLPWSLVACRTREGLGYQFFLGGMGEYGGGDAGMARLPEGDDLQVSALLFGGPPLRAIAAYVGAVSDRVSSAEVRLADGRRREVEIWPPSEGFLRYLIFFPPYGASGEVIARDAGGDPLKTVALFDALVPWTATAGIRGFPA